MSGTYLFARIGTNEIPVIAFALIRFAISAAVLFFLCKLTGRIKRIHRSDWGMLIFLSILLIPVNQGLFLFGQRLATTTHGALIYALTPIFIAIFAYLWVREMIPPLRWVGIILGVAGALYVIACSGLEFGIESFSGDILIWFAMISWALFTVFGKKFVTKYGAFFSMTAIQIVGLLIVLPLAPFAWRELAEKLATVGVAPIGWVSLAYVTLGTSVLSYALWYWALARVPAAKLGVWMSLQPVVATVYSLLVFGTSEISKAFIVGGIVSLIGVIIAQNTMDSGGEDRRHITAA
ncbi:DMT family transporter [bacterium]|nr:DMT family transporter [bacterium]